MTIESKSRLEYIWMKSCINDAWDKNKGNKLIVNCK